MNITVTLAKYEIEALISWHREQQYEAARKEEYADADGHKRRVVELERTLKIGTSGEAA